MGAARVVIRGPGAFSGTERCILSIFSLCSVFLEERLVGGPTDIQSIVFAHEIKRFSIKILFQDSISNSV